MTSGSEDKLCALNFLPRLLSVSALLPQSSKTHKESFGMRNDYPLFCLEINSYYFNWLCILSNHSTNIFWATTMSQTLCEMPDKRMKERELFLPCYGLSLVGETGRNQTIAFHSVENNVMVKFRMLRGRREELPRPDLGIRESWSEDMKLKQRCKRWLWFTYGYGAESREDIAEQRNYLLVVKGKTVGLGI